MPINMPKNNNYKYYTLLYLRCGGEILLGFKRRGFCADLYHGYGGKMDADETKEQCVVREMLEESNIAIDKDKVKLLGFTVHTEPAHVSRLVFIFTVATPSKPEATETDEMSPYWFRTDRIPYEDMLPDNRFYLPLVLDDKYFCAHFTLDPNKNVYHTDIKEFKSVDEVLGEFTAKYS